MSKPNRKVIRLQTMRAQIAQAAGLKHVDIVFELPLTLEQQQAGMVPQERVCSFLTQDYWPIDVVRSVEADGGNAAQIEMLRQVATPPEAFDELVSVAQLTVAELKELIEELSGEADSSEGEGSGSSVSSATTQEPSAPTFSATTQAVA